MARVCCGICVHQAGNEERVHCGHAPEDVQGKSVAPTKAAPESGVEALAGHAGSWSRGFSRARSRLKVLLRLSLLPAADPAGRELLAELGHLRRHHRLAVRLARVVAEIVLVIFLRAVEL